MVRDLGRCRGRGVESGDYPGDPAKVIFAGPVFPDKPVEHSVGWKSLHPDRVINDLPIPEKAGSTVCFVSAHLNYRLVNIRAEAAIKPQFFVAIKTASVQG